MTMRLDIVTNDAGEGVRREHARDLGAGVVVAIYRLMKLAQLHDLTNQAFLRQLEQTHQSIGDYCLRSGMNVSVLFAQRAVFVAGQLLKGSRAIYDSANELGATLEWCGGSELSIDKEVTQADLHGFAEAISKAMKAGRGRFVATSTKIRLREVNDAARLLGLDVEQLDVEQRIVRTYASAVVIMRRFFEDLQVSRYVLPRRIKRVAQSLVDLSGGATPAFLGVSESRNQNSDEAGRAVNSAILAVAMARQVTDDRVRLAQIAMAAMMHDVGRPRAVALAGASGGPRIAGLVPKLSDEAEDRLAAGTAAALTALGRVNEPSITRTVITFEALWLRRTGNLGPLYRGVRQATLHAKMVAIARRYNDLLTPDPGLDPPGPDYAIAVLNDELQEASDRTVLRMLVAALRFYPVGTVVQLSTGEVAEVIARGDRGAGNEAPWVRMVLDAKGGVVNAVTELELASPAARRKIVKVMNIDGWKKSLETGKKESVHPPSSRPAPSVRAEPVRSSPSSAAPLTEEVPVLEEEDEEHRAPHDSIPSISSGVMEPDSIPSTASSPSMVARAFETHGMVGQRFAEPEVQEEREERTVMQASPFAEDESPSRRHDRAVPSSRRVPALPAPSAKGTLATTPMVHVLVYMLDHSLTGSVQFQEPGGIEHVMYFRRGAPAKVRAGRMVAPLGEELAAAGLVSADRATESLEAAKRLGVLFGEYLAGEGVITRGQLATALEAQIVRKVSRLVNMPPPTTYVFYKDTNLLDGWGGEGVVACDPLNSILASVRYWHDRARIRATLSKITKQPLVLHDGTALGGLELTADEAAALAVIREERPSLSVLFHRKVADDEDVSSLVYMLAVTRQLSFPGQKAGPMLFQNTSYRPPPSQQPSDGASGSRRIMDHIESAMAVDPSGLPASLFSSPSFGPPASAPMEPIAPVLPIAPIASIAPAPPQRVMQHSAPAPVPPVSARPNPSPTLSQPPGLRTTQPSAANPIPPFVKPSVQPRPSQSAPVPRAAESKADLDMADAENALEAMTDFRMAETALQRSDLVSAERLAKKAALADPDQPEYGALLAWILAMSGKSGVVEDSIKKLNAILKEDGTCETALLYRGKLFKRAERKSEALRDFEAVLEVNPKNREAATEVRLLRSKKK